MSVVTKAGEAATGKVDTLQAQALSIVAGETRREFPAERVERISRKKRHTVAGLLIGLCVGLAAGLIGATSEPSGSYYADSAAAGSSLVAPLLGTAAGAVIGALIQTDRTVYAAPASQQP